MIINIILVILAVVVIATIVNICESKLDKERSKFSFKEAMDLIDLPIITFQAGNNKLSFLLDTGADESHITSEAAPLLNTVPFDANISDNITVAKNVSVSKGYNTTLTYKGHNYDVTLYESKEMSGAFAQLKSMYGIQIHGILGTSFFQKYRYVLDFAELTAYQK